MAAQAVAAEEMEVMAAREMTVAAMAAEEAVAVAKMAVAISGFAGRKSTAPES